MKDSSAPQVEMSEKESRKTIRTFAWASFFNDMGSDMIYPVWPLFLTTVLHANMAVIGLIDGLGDAIVSLSQAAAGYYSDKLRKRKIFIWIGYFFGSLSRLGYAIMPTWQTIIPFKVLDRAGKIRSAPRDALIADISVKNKRGGNFGLLRAMDNLGAVVGILICISLVEIIGYRNLFLLAAIPSAFGAILILVLIKEKKAEGINVFKGISFKDIDSNFRLFLFLSAIFALGAFSYSFLMIFAKENGFKLGFIPVLYLIFTATAFLFSYPFGRLADKWGRKTIMIISFLLWALVCFTCIIQIGKPGIFACFILFGMHKAALEPVQKAFVSELAPRQFRASSLGGYQMVVGIFALPSSFLAGLLWENIGILAPFYFSLSLSAIAIILLLFVKENQLSG
jgi:MFS family permease